MANYHSILKKKQKKKNEKDGSLVISAHTGLRCSNVGFDPRGRRGNILVSEHAFLSVICMDDINKCAVLWIGTLTGGPVQGESPPVLIENHIYKLIQEHQYVVIPT